MSVASALTNNWVVAGSTHPGSKNNSSGDCFKVLAWNHNVIKGKHLLLREKVATTGWQITKAAPKMPINVIRLAMKTKWWEKNMKANMKNIKSQQDFDEQLLMAGDKLTVVHFFSPSCGACKAVHSKVYRFAGMHPELQFLMVNYDEQKEMCRRLHVHVLPLFRFYRGAEGRISSFSCTISTIRKFKDALKKHGVQLESLGPEKGLEESELQSFAPPTDIPNAPADASYDMDGDVDPVAPSND